MSMLLLTERELRRAVGLSRGGVDAVADGFAKLADGRVAQPPILRVDVAEHRGEVDVKSAYVRGWDSFAVKISTGFFDNPRIGLPTGSGLMVLLSAETGETKGLLLDNGYLTRVRTALAGAVAARELARPDATDVGVIGAGDQARWQLRAIALVRSLGRVRVWGRRAEAARAYAEEMAGELGVPVDVADSAEEVVRSSALVVTTTPSETPIVRGGWLHAGLHVTAVGSDAESKRELDRGVLQSADLFVCDDATQSRRLGELRALEQGGAHHGVEPVALGSIVAGTHPGRSNASQVTVCDLTGTGMQDTVIARLAFARAVELGLGKRIEPRS